MNSLTILALLCDLYQQLMDERVENAALQAKNTELHAACAQLQEEVRQLKADAA